MRQVSSIAATLTIAGLAFVAGIGLSPATAVGDEGAAAAPAAVTAGVCQNWEISMWNPRDDCEFKGKAPWTNRDEWCPVPGNAEPLGTTLIQSGAMSADLAWAVRRCKD